MPLNSKPLELYDTLFEMLRCKLVPILAHPERYSFIQKEPELLYDLIEKGVLMQCNFASFIGYYGTKSEIIAKQLLIKNMVHLLGTDVHKQESIYPKMPKIISEIKKIIGDEKLRELTEINPELVLNNKKIEIDDPKHLKLSFKEVLKMNLRK